MQYKIPVQIENEDPIIFGLSLRQLIILMIWGWISYSIFTWLQWVVPIEVAAFPAIILWIITFIIAVFKYSEMTFVPFVLSFVRYHTNYKTRSWQKWVDSFQPLDIWYVTNTDKKTDKDIDFSSKIDKINSLEDKLKKL